MIFTINNAWKYHIRLIAIAAVFAALTGAVFDEHAAHAQGSDNDYVDVALTLEVLGDTINEWRDLKIIVMNHGSKTAYDLEVVVDVVYPDETSYFNQVPAEVPVGSMSLENDGYSIRWSIPALGGLQREEVTAEVFHKRSTAPVFDKSEYPHETYGEVTTSSFESDRHKGNNTDRVWSVVTGKQGSSVAYRQAEGDYSVTASVDNPSPSAGTTVNFTVTVSNRIRFDVIDQKVAIELTDGLTVSGDAVINYGIFTKPDSVSYSNGVFNIGTLDYSTVLASGSVSAPTHSVTLPVTVSSSAVVNEQCLTATITGNPPPGAGPFDDDKSDNVAKVCLGTMPVSPLLNSQVDHINIYPCVGNSVAPCDNTDDVRVRAIDRSFDSEVILGPGKALVQVQDRPNRKYDSHTNSVNGGDIVSWQIPVKWDASEINAVHTQWSNLRDGFTARGTSGGEPPGKIHIRAFEGQPFEIIYKMTSATGWTGEDTVGYDPVGTDAPNTYTAEFEKLGRYKLGFTAKLTRATRDGDEDCDPNTATPPVNQRFCATETYIFHFGPIAELTVEDGGASPHVPADQNALTIVAINNGPDEPSGGARVTGLPKGAQVFHGSHGSYNGSTGEWNVGELKVRGYYRSAGVSEPTLVLSASAGDTANVRIASAKDYEVCVGPKDNPGDLTHTTQAACEAVTNASWNSVPVYDYKPGNNSATISAARGTGGRTVPVGGPAAPANLTAQTGTTTVKWDPVGLLYGVPVARYEVQELQGSDWRQLDRATTHNEYAVMQPRGLSYRVRAVNAAGAKGPWSRSTVQVRAGHAGPPLNLRAQADGNNAIDISWDAPDDIGGSAINGYTVQWSPNEPGSWRNAGTTSASVRTFKHRGLSVGAVNYYRVAARNNGGLGLWSDPVMGQTVSGTPDAPTLQAKTLSSYQIELTWNQPRDNGQAITGYELEWSADGSSSWQDLAEPGADAKTYTDGTLQSNTKRYYRIRAVNSVGEGAWSGTVSATTQRTPPTAPTLTSVEADGPNAIEVTWEEPFVFADELAITQYQVQWAKDQHAEIWRGPQTLSASTLSWRHTRLQPEETWYYRVRATNGGNRWSVWSHIKSATTASENVPTAAPGGLKATYDPASFSVTLTWNPPSGQATITGYDLQYSEDNNRWQDLTTGQNALTYTDGGYHLYPGAEVHYRVRAASDDGAGPWSRAVRVSVPADPPDAPTVVNNETDGSNHILMQWEPPRYDGGLPITGYRLLWCRVLDDTDDDKCRISESNSPANPPGYSTISLSASARSYTHSVNPGYNYYYLLRASNGGNRWSEWDEYDIFYGRTYAGVPAAPRLTAQAVDSAQIKLTWTKPNDYGSPISNYWLYVYNGEERLYDFNSVVLDVVTVPGDKTEWTIGELRPGMTRYFRVRALNDNGEGKYSALRQATTPSTASSQGSGGERDGDDSAGASGSSQPTPEPESTPTPVSGTGGQRGAPGSSQPTPEPTPTATPEPTATATPEPTPTATPEPTATATPEPTATATPEPTATATPEPTPTPTPEPTPTAAATPEPTPEPTPTATPEAGSESGASGDSDESGGESGADDSEPNPCTLSLPDDTLPVTIEGAWLADCVYPYELDDVIVGDRYYRYVEFETLTGDSWVAGLESSEDTVLVLFEWDATSESWAFVEMNDDIQPGNTDSRIEWASVAGQSYLLDVTTYEAATLGDFTLTLNAAAGSAQNSLLQPNTSGTVPVGRRK